jgi:hypothetical protein
VEFLMSDILGRLDTAIVDCKERGELSDSVLLSDAKEAIMALQIMNDTLRAALEQTSLVAGPISLERPLSQIKREIKNAS